MKKIICILSILLILVSCTPSNSEVKDNLGFARDLFESDYLTVEELKEKVSLEEFQKVNLDEILILDKVREDNKIIEYADGIMNDEIFFDPNWEPVKIENINWEEDPYSHDSWVLYYQSLNFLPYLNLSYKLTGRNDYLEKAADFIKQWIDLNSVDEIIISEFTWNDHATANRTKNLIHFLSQYRESEILEIEFFYEVVYLIYQQGLFMSNSKNYVPSNHGIMQNQSLLEISLIFSDFPDSASWKEIAMSRLLESMERGVTSEGVHKEHSPTYHVLVQNLYMETQAFLESMGYSNDKFTNTIEAMNEYVSYNVTPSGHYPQISDTFRMKNNRYKEYPELPEKIFKESGVGFLRDKISNNDDIYFMFISAYNSKVHKHKDDLSYILSIGETDFFVDGGNYSYNKGKERSYFVSPYAHNTIVLNEEAWLFDDSKIGNPQIEEYYLSESHSYIKASHSMYESAIINRSILFVKPGVFIIHDKVESENKEYETVEQIFNIGKDVEITHKSNTSYELQSVLDDTIVYFNRFNNGNNIVKKYSGSEDPFLGWQAHELDKKHPINSLIFESESLNEDIYTVISINEDIDIQNIEFDGDSYTLTVDGDTYVYEIK